MKSDEKKIGVYILRCSNNRYYVGSTVNLDRRLLEHQGGLVQATKHVLPISLKFFYPCSGIHFARRIECDIKRKKSRVIIEKIIADGYIKFTGS